MSNTATMLCWKKKIIQDQDLCFLKNIPYEQEEKYRHVWWCLPKQ